MKISFCSVLVLLSVQAVWAVNVFSPDGILKADLIPFEGGLHAVISSNEKEFARVDLGGPVLQNPFEGGFLFVTNKVRAARSAWTPVWGDRAEVRDDWNATIFTLREKGQSKRTLQIEVRMYNEGFAARYMLPLNESWAIVDEKTSVHYPDGSAAWAITNTEDTFPERAIPLADLKGRKMMPLTVEVPEVGVCSLLEAHCVHYPRAKAEACGSDGVKIALLGRDAKGTEPFVTPWRALICAPTAAKLVDRSTLVLNLNPPCEIDDTSWIHPGLTVSNEGNCPIQMDKLLKVGELASANNFRYLQIDWGWYGTEWTWTDKDRETFLKTNPDWKDDPDWARNSFANPRVAAKGRVGYRPDWKAGTTVDLDIAALVKFLKDRGMGLCLYMHGKVLEANDMDELFGLYEQWGLAGLKPGFVRYGNAASTDWNRKLVELAARHHLWLCIHDAHVPDGMERTYPNLMLCEGGGGQEGNHPVRQDVTLPFTRCLAGPFDYTPALFRKGASHAHMVAFFLAYPGASSVVRGNTPAQFTGKGSDAYGPELAFVKKLPMTYDESRVLDAKIGAHLVVARRKGNTWFLAGMTGAVAHTTPLKLDFLASGSSHTLTLYKDCPEGGDDRRRTLVETRTVTSSDTLDVWMANSGGFVAVLE